LLLAITLSIRRSFIIPSLQKVLYLTLILTQNFKMNFWCKKTLVPSSLLIAVTIQKL
jgi:hypothetical protein